MGYLDLNTTTSTTLSPSNPQLSTAPKSSEDGDMSFSTVCEGTIPTLSLKNPVDDEYAVDGWSNMMQYCVDGRRVDFKPPSD